MSTARHLSLPPTQASAPPPSFLYLTQGGRRNQPKVTQLGSWGNPKLWARERVQRAEHSSAGWRTGSDTQTHSLPPRASWVQPWRPLSILGVTLVIPGITAGSSYEPLTLSHTEQLLGMIQGGLECTQQDTFLKNNPNLCLSLRSPGLHPRSLL